MGVHHRVVAQIDAAVDKLASANLRPFGIQADGDLRCVTDRLDRAWQVHQLGVREIDAKQRRTALLEALNRSRVKRCRPQRTQNFRRRPA